MNIKINNKTYEIKPGSELTVKEYLKYWSVIGDGVGQYGAITSYITAVTGFEIDDLMHLDFGKDAVRRINAYVDEVPTPDNMPAQTEFYYKRTGARFYQKSVSWRTLGARKMLEEKELNNPLEQCVYLLACYLSKNYDNDKVEQIYDELQSYRALDVFGFNLFFFKKLMIGSRLEINFWQALRLIVSTNIRGLLNTLRARD